MNVEHDRQGGGTAYAALADMLAAARPVPPDAALAANWVPPEELPDAPRGLLVHNEHMTLRLREHYGCAVNLRVLRERRGDGVYAREILLLRADNGRPAEFGIVRIYENLLPPAAVAEIHEHRRPLGDILIASDVLRRVEPRWYFRFSPESIPSGALGGGTTYGRLGVIYCNEAPAIDLLEVVVDDGQI